MEYPFPCGEKKIWSNIKGSQKIIKMVVCVSLFLSLLTAPNIKNSHIKARIFFYLSKNSPNTNSNSNSTFQPQWITGKPVLNQEKF